jgi:hypothetical protein
MVLVMSVVFITCGLAMAKKAKAPAAVPQTPLVDPISKKGILYLGTWMGEMVGFPERGVYFEAQKGLYRCVKNRYGDFLCFMDVAPKYMKKTNMAEVEISIVPAGAKKLTYWPEKWY